MDEATGDLSPILTAHLGHHDSRALPFGAGLFPAGATLRVWDVAAESGVLLRVDITSDCGGTWRLLRNADRWRLVAASAVAPACRLSIPQEIAWRIFTKGIGRAEAESQTRVEGDRLLAEPVLSMVAIVA